MNEIRASADEVQGATNYETLFVEGLFRPWAVTVATTAGLHEGQRVLDVACGTGVLAREALERTGTRGHVVGLDPAPGMLAVAERMEPSYPAASESS